jgi:hypothetical protein
MGTTIAPGGPGSRPTWTSSAKDMVATALGTSRVWVTLGAGRRLTPQLLREQLDHLPCRSMPKSEGFFHATVQPPCR